MINYVWLAPALFTAGVLDAKLGYKTIVGWSVWLGASMLLTSGLLAFSFQWRSVVAAVRSVGAAFGTAVASAEVPMSWFVVGVAVFGSLVVALQWLFFGITPWMGILAVFLSFFIALVASRVTGETDTTPTGALGKITQVTFGALAPGNVTTNLMTANVSAGVALHSADLLTDLKSGYLLGADPRQQFWAQFFGVMAGSCFVVPAYRLLIPTADVLGSDAWPAPGAQTWKGVAVMLAQGFDTLHPTAQTALWVGGVVGIGLVLLEKALPRYKKFIPSAAALGLAFTTPAYNSISMFLGAMVGVLLTMRNKDLADRTVIPVSSGIIAGESLMGILIAVLVVAGLLQS
jgi:OPT family oligopeptide transporter